MRKYMPHKFVQNTPPMNRIRFNILLRKTSPWLFTVVGIVVCLAIDPDKSEGAAGRHDVRYLLATRCEEERKMYCQKERSLLLLGSEIY